MQQLGGHPLAMRAILLRLPEKMQQAWKKELEEGSPVRGDESTRVSMPRSCVNSRLSA